MSWLLLVSAVIGCLQSNRLRLHFVGGWTYEAFAVFARQQAVGVSVVGEDLFHRIESQLWAERKWILVEFDPVLFEMLDGALKGLGIVVKGFYLRESLTQVISRDGVLLAEVIRDVAKVTDRSRQMTFAYVGVEHLHVAFLAGFDEVVSQGGRGLKHILHASGLRTSRVAPRKGGAD